MRAFKIIGWIWRGLVALSWLAVLLGFSAQATGMNWIVDVEVWLTNKVPDPLLFAFLTGLMIAIFIIPAGWKAFMHYVLGKETVREELTRVRNLGVGIRNEVSNGLLTPEQWPDWRIRATSWNATAIKTIRKSSPADAGWFEVMDVMQPPRLDPLIHPDIQDEDVHPLVIAYQLHDERLKRLGQLIEGEVGNVCP